MNTSAVYQLLTYVIGEEETRDVLKHVSVDPAILAHPARGDVDRAAIAQALSLVLFHDLLRRVPSARRYVHETKPADERLILDHGAVRTVKLAGMGQLPAGELAIRRLLLPLGYALAEEYPMPSLRMIGRSYRHLDYPAQIPQFFVSEILPEAFSQTYQQRVAKIFESSRDPVSTQLATQLAALDTSRALPFHDATDIVLKAARCFDRQHDMPRLDDYEALLTESAEMAWIATEGNTFNHITVRVGDVGTLHGQLREAGFAIKPEVEVSSSGTVLQTALRADPVSRRFRGPDSSFVERDVPGSFCEFIERKPTRDTHGVEGMDLRFDSNNATAIFKMTAVSAP